MQDNDSRNIGPEGSYRTLLYTGRAYDSLERGAEMVCCGRLSISVCWLSRQGQERKSFIRNG